MTIVTPPPLTPALITVGRELMTGLPKLPWHHEAIEDLYGDDHQRWGDLYAADGACLFSVETDGFFALPAATAAAICHAVNTWPLLAEKVEELERDAALRFVDTAAAEALLRAQIDELRGEITARDATIAQATAEAERLHSLLAEACDIGRRPFIDDERQSRLDRIAAIRKEVARV